MGLLEGHRHFSGVAGVAGKLSKLGGLELAGGIAVNDPADVSDTVADGVVLRGRRGEAELDLSGQAATRTFLHLGNHHREHICVHGVARARPRRNGQGLVGGNGVACQGKGNQRCQRGQGLFHRTSSKTVRYRALYGMTCGVTPVIRPVRHFPISLLVMPGAVKGNVAPAARVGQSPRHL